MKIDQTVKSSNFVSTPILSCTFPLRMLAAFWYEVLCVYLPTVSKVGDMGKNLAAFSLEDTTRSLAFRTVTKNAQGQGQGGLPGRPPRSHS